MEQNNWLTVDIIIAKFVPILGALLFITGLGYLIYTSVWEAMDQTMRLGIGFFVSIVIIGSAFSFSDKLRYFADVVMGGGILLLYATLIYGSRTTEAATAIIPEVATLVTAFIFTLAVAYFSSLRKSKVILALGILGAYLTPFVIGQNDIWASNISFNAYLVYFAAVNIVVFLMGREIAIHDLIPLNLLGLFFGTYTLHHLIYTGDIQAVSAGFFQSNTFTLILLAVLVVMSVMSIAFSSRYFSPREEVWISAWYLLPFLWFYFHSTALVGLSVGAQVFSYIVIAAAYFWAWYVLRPLETSRYQHVAAYVGGMIAVVFAVDAALGHYELYANILIAYIGLIFAVIYVLDGNKGERILAAFLFSFFGWLLSLIHIYSDSSNVVYPTVFAVLALVPAILLAVAVRIQGKTPDTMKRFIDVYSAIAALIAVLIVVIKVLKGMDFGFAIFVFPGFLMVLTAYIQWAKNPTRGTLMRVGTIWLSVGFFWSFLYFLSNFIPHVADDEHFWIDGGIFANWHYIKGVFAVVTYFLALQVSRDIQRIEKADRPSFLLVIMGYTTLLLLVNFAIITFCNDIGVAFETGGPRAIGTTIWWIVLSISMLMIGIHHGRGYRAEKLLGLLLLLLTIGKIAIYDLASMNMDKKIIVLMVVGGLIMMFSYFLQVKGYLKDEQSK
jgi:hypothetical protein